MNEPAGLVLVVDDDEELSEALTFAPEGVIAPNSARTSPSA